MPKLLHSPSVREIPAHRRLLASPWCLLQSRDQANGAAKAQPCYHACEEDSWCACQVLPWLEDYM